MSARETKPKGRSRLPERDAVPPRPAAGEIDRPPPRPLCLVGIGASAGGLEAILTLFGALPPGLGMAFVVVTHMPADGPSQLTSCSRGSPRCRWWRPAPTRPSSAIGCT